MFRARYIRIAFVFFLFRHDMVSHAETSTGKQGVEEKYQRSAILLKAQAADPTQTYVGDLRWSTMAEGNGQESVWAIANIPQLGVAATLTIRKAADDERTTVMDIDCRFERFEGKNDFEVQDVRMIKMRSNTDGLAEELSGSYSHPDKNYFRFELTAGDVETNNINLLLRLNWLDIVIRLSDGRWGKITFEKGMVGQKVIRSEMIRWGLTE